MEMEMHLLQTENNMFGGENMMQSNEIKMFKIMDTSTATMHIATKLGEVVPYPDRLPYTKSHDLLSRYLAGPRGNLKALHLHYHNVNGL